MTENNDSWRALAKFLNEEGPPPPALAERQRRLESESLPPDLDAQVLEQIRAGVKEATRDAQDLETTRITTTSRLAANRLLRIASAAAAILIVGFGAWLGLRGWISGDALNVSALHVIGPVTLNETAFAVGEDKRQNRIISGSELALESGALLYLEFAPGFVVRVAGPARLYTRATGIELTSGELALLADGQGFPGSAKEYEQAHSRFRLQTPGASYRLLGTCFQIQVPNATDAAEPVEDQLLVLEGAVEVKVEAIVARVSAGEGARLRQGADPTNHIEGNPRIFVLQEYDREGLSAMRDSLQRFASPDGKMNRDALISTATVEELRALYGSVMEFQMRDGRSLVGFMLQTPDGDFIHTVDGRIAVRAADVLSFVLLE